MDDIDLITFQKCMIGMYVYSIYEKETGGIDITTNREYFYYILGTIIKESYPQCYQSLLYDVPNVYCITDILAER
jgi:hypothetical protein